MSVSQRGPAVLRPTLKRLAQPEALERDWDSYGGLPPCARSLTKAQSIMVRMAKRFEERYGLDDVEAEALVISLLSRWLDVIHDPVLHPPELANAPHSLIQGNAGQRAMELCELMAEELSKRVLVYPVGSPLPRTMDDPQQP